MTESTSPAEALSPRSQQKGDPRRWWPAWAKQLPYFKLPPADLNFSLVPKDEALELLRPDPNKATDSTASAYPPFQATEETLRAIESDLDLLEREVLQFFRERDLEAKLQQNRYRLYQIGFITLSALATAIGSLLALALTQQPPIWVPLLSFAETVVALLATFLAQISGRESPFLLWIENRRAAEGLRREYFRYLMRLPPYDNEAMKPYERRLLLAERAALINRGTSPDDRASTALSGALTAEGMPHRTEGASKDG
ncbi:MAG: hypothetical protein CUN49_07330 [Candidatus Thermofonsia Clade 1 bacterium]|jgi:hypothetical protein|uniref:SMODS and SLOG-associating 2TM effector domain-containing protein n=1 Tax=Candidatus Thermofonsia Clade 1 bacterium TaxID=2364210 RepID=A0A2M8PEV1_9CHLR|nr:MAG: hypothetical protein CUN49_07330 [Candidatus Thermofonsia Clade 1 bacterium]RMF52006.1 MAG: DUF4231 domain-containing protein [Chloroflexota bacterium]